MRCLRSEGPSYWFNKTKHLIEAILDKHQNISYSNIWQLNDYWGIVQKASTLQNMAIEKHLIIEWVTGWVSEAWPLGGFLIMVTGSDSEAWLLGGFLRHGHWVGF